MSVAPSIALPSLFFPSCRTLSFPSFVCLVAVVVHLHGCGLTCVLVPSLLSPYNKTLPFPSFVCLVAALIYLHGCGLTSVLGDYRLLQDLERETAISIGVLCAQRGEVRVMSSASFSARITGTYVVMCCASTWLCCS